MIRQGKLRPTAAKYYSPNCYSYVMLFPCLVTPMHCYSCVLFFLWAYRKAGTANESGTAISDTSTVLRFATGTTAGYSAIMLQTSRTNRPGLTAYYATLPLCEVQY